MKRTAPRARTAPAKINLTLSVGSPGPDGFHPIESVFLRIGLADVLDVKVRSPHPTFETNADDLYVDGVIDCPPAENLVLRAAQTIRRQAGVALAPLHFTLQKQIPVAAGLGGGSSDAAATISAAESAWGGRFRPEPRRRIIEELGSDVWFFASGAEAALVQGRGELVEPLPAPRGALGILLVTPEQRLRTGDVYAAYDSNERYRGRATPAVEATKRLATLLRGGVEAARVVQMAPELRDANDLWPAASRVLGSLVALRGSLEEQLGRPLLMTGSGPTLDGHSPTVSDAGAAARRLADWQLPDLLGATIIATDATNPIPLWRTPG